MFQWVTIGHFQIIITQTPAADLSEIGRLSPPWLRFSHHRCCRERWGPPTRDTPGSPRLLARWAPAPAEPAAPPDSSYAPDAGNTISFLISSSTSSNGKISHSPGYSGQPGIWRRWARGTSRKRMEWKVCSPDRRWRYVGSAPWAPLEPSALRNKRHSVKNTSLNMAEYDWNMHNNTRKIPN